jgi:hypothetical protein
MVSETFAGESYLTGGNVGNAVKSMQAQVRAHTKTLVMFATSQPALSSDQTVFWQVTLPEVGAVKINSGGCWGK